MFVRGGIRCPCIRCVCENIWDPATVRVHLFRHGFKPNYLVWTNHGEEFPISPQENLAAESIYGLNTNFEDHFGYMHQMVNEN